MIIFSWPKFPIKNVAIGKFDQYKSFSFIDGGWEKSKIFKYQRTPGTESVTPWTLEYGTYFIGAERGHERRYNMNNAYPFCNKVPKPVISNNRFAKNIQIGWPNRHWSSPLKSAIFQKFRNLLPSRPLFENRPIYFRSGRRCSIWRTGYGAIIIATTSGPSIFRATWSGSMIAIFSVVLLKLFYHQVLSLEICQIPSLINPKKPPAECFSKPPISNPQMTTVSVRNNAFNPGIRRHSKLVHEYENISFLDGGSKAQH